MFKLFLVFLGIPLALVAIMLIVNTIGSSVTHQYVEEQCTRYCHDHGCPHFQEQLKLSKEWHKKMDQAHQATIRVLQNNPFGISYQSINLLIFVIILPLYILFVFWNLIRS